MQSMAGLTLLLSDLDGAVPDHDGDSHDVGDIGSSESGGASDTFERKKEASSDNNRPLGEADKGKSRDKCNLYRGVMFRTKCKPYFLMEEVVLQISRLVFLGLFVMQ
jgi:hypothetical protein